MYAIRSYYARNITHVFQSPVQPSMMIIIAVDTQMDHMQFFAANQQFSFHFLCKIVRNRNKSIHIGTSFGVITSYSIHYTKLYEKLAVGWQLKPVQWPHVAFVRHSFHSANGLPMVQARLFRDNSWPQDFAFYDPYPYNREVMPHFLMPF